MVLINAIMLAGVVIFIMPYVFMIASSFKPQPQIFRLPFRILPDRLYLGNFRFLFAEYPFWRWYANTAIVTALQVSIAMFFSSLAGFAFAKYEFRYKRPLFLVVLISLMLPIQVLITPLFIQMATLEWLDTYHGVILPFAISPFFIFLMRQYMMSTPNDLLDSARIDGCTELGMFVRIVMPLQKPAFAVVGILAFVMAWTAFLWPVIVLQSRSMFVLNVGIATMAGPYRVPYGAILAASSLATIPIILFFLLMQRYFIEGLTAGALKSS